MACGIKHGNRATDPQQKQILSELRAMLSYGKLYSRETSLQTSSTFTLMQALAQLKQHQEASLFMSRQSHVNSAIQRPTSVQHSAKVTDDTGLFCI